MNAKPKHRIRALLLIGMAAATTISAWVNAETLIAPDSEVQLLRGGFEFIEGPTADTEGNIFFSDIPQNLIYKWSVDGELSVARENSGGANGLIFDDAGNLYACEGSAQRITMMDSDGKISVIAERYEGKRLNSPNDLWIDEKGGFYFTDPRYSFGEFPVEQDGEHVYYVSPDRSSIVRVVDDMEKPNGVIGSLDGKKLYVADTSGKVFVFDIQPDAKLSNKKLFAPQGSDGVTMDERGNVYLTWVSGVAIYSPEGEKLEVIKVPEMPANVGFGGADGKTLFITARTGLYSVRMQVKGRD